MAMKLDTPAGPYCYALVDPANGEPFYIGKGRGRRMFHHELAARRGKPGAKCDRIREILAAGGCVEYRVLGEYATDTKAYEAEKVWIAQSRGLTNLTAGGGGAQLGGESGFRAALRAFLDAIDLRKRVKPLDTWLRRPGADPAVYWMLVKEIDELIEFLANQLRRKEPGTWVL